MRRKTSQKKTNQTREHAFSFLNRLFVYNEHVSINVTAKKNPLRKQLILLLNTNKKSCMQIKDQRLIDNLNKYECTLHQI